MEEYVIKDGKRLRVGCTTGSCAAAAAAAAARLLLTGVRQERVTLRTPRGVPLTLPVEDLCLEGGTARAAVRKDAGDDPDVTDGALICAQVSKAPAPGVAIDGGAGVGRVTQPGLDQPVGAAAINSTPRRMIREGVERVMEDAGYEGGLSVVISVPEGEALAKKTFNPRLGILGGVSILGTTGIVEPMSERALVDTIKAELSLRRAAGADAALLTPGNYGADFLRDGLGLDPARAVLTSNFIGKAVDLCRALGFRRALLVGHIGKLVKLAGGMFNTHSRYGDCRLEILAAMAGAEGLSPEQIRAVLASVSCDEGLRVIQKAGLLERTMARLTARVGERLQYRAGPGLETGCILFSKAYGLLGQTENASRFLEETLWYTL